MIIIFSTAGDLHALAVLREFERRSLSNCHLYPVDQLAHHDRVHFETGAEAESALTCYGERPILLRDASVIWWRRPALRELPAAELFVQNECHSAFWGMAVSSFHGLWVSTPDATVRASNKIVQLRAAQEIGFRVPKTLITQNKAAVVNFFEQCNHSIIVKSLVGNAEPMLFTRRLEAPATYCEDAYLACPSIYQELIPGRRHCRLVCFGGHAYSAALETEDIDWRPNLDIPFYEFRLPESVIKKSHALLKYLGLEMGVFDLKETPEGEWVWLEVNPQGQFLFLEPKTGIPLASKFADYLVECSNAMGA